MIEARDVSFHFGEKEPLPVIESVSFGAKKGELVSIIGPSGCGKSTLLRVIAGLIHASGGEVLYNGRKIVQPIKDISFVFQDFALLPWLTNLENVKLGLSYSGLNDEEKEKLAVKEIANVGLDSFANYYPNALSGGMKQRIGIARALISEPKVLLMDEPFSALDELTANTLRGDVIYMLKNKNVSVDLVIMVTHNVEEAVEMSEKIVVLSDKPSRVKKVVDIKAGYPRSRHSKWFEETVENVYEWLTASH